MLYSQLKATELVFLLAGPNVIESEEYIMKLAKHIKTITSVGIPLVFKSSFVKANRTSSKSFCGLEMVEVLKILEKVKVAYDLPIVIDVHDSIQCEVVGRIADIIQITAFLCHQVNILYIKIILDGGGVASGGLRELIPCIVRTAVAIGVDGIFMEVHDDLLSAPIDGPTQWPFRHLEELLEDLVAIARISKEKKKKFNIDPTPFHE
ncbi:2-dehydro-3-deoxyphosphooctonate aldolase-like [Arachis ipaensis]|uniref:2-dehydro-3-deoxyphosphooctonate aldolase-like n=1 Tax=Arachis ipaensis TaxID=130454 RepID=UPI000A2B6643|nr:2-dehydro-3-deoxyphosphooctonate aldolase-like [Arachis ipaensis]